MAAEHTYINQEKEILLGKLNVNIQIKVKLLNLYSQTMPEITRDPELGYDPNALDLRRRLYEQIEPTVVCLAHLWADWYDLIEEYNRDALADQVVRRLAGHSTAPPTLHNPEKAIGLCFDHLGPEHWSIVAHHYLKICELDAANGKVRSTSLLNHIVDHSKQIRKKILRGDPSVV